KRLILATEPGYPVYERGALFAGAEFDYLPLLEENGFLPDLDGVPAETWERTSIVWINYPNNPTGAVAPLEFLERPTRLAAAHDFVQRASVVAWGDEEHVERTREIYARRRQVLLPALARAGIRVAGSEATMYLWLETPGGESAEALAERLLAHGLIVSPGTF